MAAYGEWTAFFSCLGSPHSVPCSFAAPVDIAVTVLLVPVLLLSVWLSRQFLKLHRYVAAEIITLGLLALGVGFVQLAVMAVMAAAGGSSLFYAEAAAHVCIALGLYYLVANRRTVPMVAGLLGFG